MLRRANLDHDACAQLADALHNEGDGRLLTENTVNLATLVGFLGTRFLPMAPIAPHAHIQGEERDWDLMLMRAADAWVLLQQLRREGSEYFNEGGSVSAFLVLSSSLPFATEQRTEGWPLRVRQTLLEIVDWTLSAPRLPDAPLWRALADPASNPRILAPDTDKLRQVLAGQQAAGQLWSSWACDEDAASHDFQQAMVMRQIANQLLSPAAGKKSLRS